MSKLTKGVLAGLLTAGLLGCVTSRDEPLVPAPTTTVETTGTGTTAEFVVHAETPRLKRAAERAVKVVPEIKEWTDGEWTVETGSVRDLLGETDIYSCITTVDLSNVEDTARDDGIDLDEYLAFVLAHEAAHCHGDDDEYRSVKAEKLYASRTHSKALAAEARCTADNLDSTGNYAGEVNCQA
jgi:hypothetical protein